MNTIKTEIKAFDPEKWATKFLAPVEELFMLLHQAVEENKKLREEITLLQNRLNPPSPAKRVTHSLVDLPEGWLYGFPKVYTGDVTDLQGVIDWAIKEGYPTKVISEYKDKFYIRVIEMDESND